MLEIRTTMSRGSAWSYSRGSTLLVGFEGRSRFDWDPFEAKLPESSASTINSSRLFRLLDPELARAGMTGGTEDVGVEAAGGTGAVDEFEPADVLAVVGLAVVVVVVDLGLAGMETEAWPVGPDKGFPSLPPSPRSPPWLPLTP